MTTIDQRILIPASPETIWQYISDIEQNPSWQTDTSSISFLSSRRSGPGVRWRSSTANRREYVLETTAWYDGLGYEYMFVDGADFREAKGRIRLQEIPEGTVVQWTLTYELGGIAGGLRNALGLKRSQEKLMVESLRTLWRVVNENRDRNEDYRSKSLMRDALDYEARAQYKARHASSVDELEQEDRDEHAIFKPATREPAEPTLVAAIPEPPVEDDDTRPSIAIKKDDDEHPSQTEVPEVQAELEAEPTEDAGVEAPTLETEPPVNQSEDAVPIEPLHDVDMPVEMPPVEMKEAAEPAKPEESPPPVAMDENERFKPPPVPIMDEPPATPEVEAQDAPTRKLDAVETASEIAQADQEEAEAPTAEEEPPIPVVEETSPANEEEKPPAEPVTAEAAPEEPAEEEAKKSTQESAKLDTDQVSIWEIFNVPRPSETQEIAAVKIEESLPEIEQAPVEPRISLPGLVGLRVKMRRKKVKLRRYR